MDATESHKVSELTSLENMANELIQKISSGKVSERYLDSVLNYLLHSKRRLAEDDDVGLAIDDLVEAIRECREKFGAGSANPIRGLIDEVEKFRGTVMRCKTV